MNEWYRVPKFGGGLRIAVPNFEAVVEEYLSSRNLKRIFERGRLMSLNVVATK